MAYRELTGNIFNSKATTLVNTVNCVGAMGKGIALEFRRRYPEMFAIYQQDCLAKKLVPGRIYSYPQSSGLLILNFAIKNDWKHPSKVEWIESCLKQFAAGYKKKGIQSIAFPWMGAMNGGIPLEIIQSLTRQYLRNLEDIDIEVYSFDPNISDPLFDRLKQIAASEDPERYFSQSNLQRKSYRVIIETVQYEQTESFSRLISTRVVGKVSIDKLYFFLRNVDLDKPDPNQEKGKTEQPPLF
ncbi:MAG: macro domain-containing protein [Anaerolineaceae bacterium]|nr:macro domain-containing protein [Anaerolineaceae bacterium]